MEEELNKRPSSTYLYCIYDMEVSPCSYDFLTFLYTAEVCRIRRKLDKIKLYIVKATHGDFRQDSLRSTIQNENYFNNVIIPGISLLGSCVSFSWSSREELAWLNVTNATQIFPRGYSVANPTAEYVGRELVASKVRGDKIAAFKAPEYAEKLAKKFHQSLDGKNFITVTLRELEREDPDDIRKMKIDVWKSIFKKIQEMGIVPVIIRDTQNVFNEPLFEDAVELSLASLHLPFRVAIYEKALLNFIKTNGPIVTLLFGNAPGIILFEPDNKNFSTSDNWFIEKFGMVRGSQFPMQTKNTICIWGSENESLITDLIEISKQNLVPFDSGDEFNNEDNLLASLNTAISHLLGCLQFNILEEDVSLFKAIKAKISVVAPDFDLIGLVKESTSIAADAKANFFRLAQKCDS